MLIRFDLDAGEMTMLANDSLDATEFGTVQMVRASHVEFDADTQSWAVYAPDMSEMIRGGFKRRADALSWEVRWAEGKM